MTSPARPRNALITLAVAHVALTIGVIAATHFLIVKPSFHFLGPPVPAWRQALNAPLYGAVLATLQSQAVLAATVLWLGPGSFEERLRRTATLVGALMALVTVSLGLVEGPPFASLELFLFLGGLAIFFGAPILLAGVVGWPARRAGWLYRDASEPASSRPVQFSITQSLALMVVAAALLAIARALHANSEAVAALLNPPDASPGVRFALGAVRVALLTLSFAGSGVLATAAAAGPRIRVGFALTAIAAGCGCGAISAFAAGSIDSDLRGALTIGGALNAAIVILSLLLLRAGGLRIDRAPLAEAETASPPNAIGDAASNPSESSPEAAR